jgi:uncharacterized membrane protein YeaQ/YmgE (transglycosylase-associated protein family)
MRSINKDGTFLVQSTLVDLLLLAIGGVVGGIAAGAATKEYSASILTNAIAGAIGGGIGGYVLNEFIPAMVDLNGNPHFDESILEQASIECLPDSSLAAS